MTVTTLFFIFLAILVIGIVGAVANLFFSLKSNSDIENMFFGHLIFMLIYVAGLIGCLITGVIWVVNKLS